MEGDTQLYVHQNAGQTFLAQSYHRRFHHDRMPPNTSECCPYDSRDCNKKKKDKNYIVLLTVAPLKDGKRELENTHMVRCPAGGYVVVTGTYDSFSYKSYDAEHNLY
ncbi:hypothetical protein BDC45DRAFT_530479 [Circinella umbellata]|nr:hypothetical protein BDC45DRAFT_530479 [Circinella umbellata]